MATIEEIKHAIDKLDSKLDRLDDKLESQYRENATQRIQLTKDFTRMESKVKVMWGVMGTLGAGVVAIALKVFMGV